MTNCAWSQFAIKHRHTQYDDYDDFLTTTFNYHCFYNLHCGTFASHNTFNFSYKLWAKFCVFFGRRLSEVGAGIIFLGIKRVRQLKKISRKCAVLFSLVHGKFHELFFPTRRPHADENWTHIDVLNFCREKKRLTTFKSLKNSSLKFAKKIKINKYKSHDNQPLPRFNDDDGQRIIEFLPKI